MGKGLVRNLTYTYTNFEFFGNFPTRKCFTVNGESNGESSDHWPFKDRKCCVGVHQITISVTFSFFLLYFFFLLYCNSVFLRQEKALRVSERENKNINWRRSVFALYLNPQVQGWRSLIRSLLRNKIVISSNFLFSFFQFNLSKVNLFLTLKFSKIIT